MKPITVTCDQWDSDKSLIGLSCVAGGGGFVHVGPEITNDQGLWMLEWLRAALPDIHKFVLEMEKQ